jgi:heme/copper-type cytochrome/quinol oxidase subunit 2
MDWPEKNDGIFALLNSSLNGTVRVPTGSTITLEQLGLAASGKWAIEYYEPTPPVNPDQQDSLLWIYIAIAAGTFVLLAATIIIIIIKRKKGKGKAKAANNKNEKVQKTKKIANPKAKKAPTKKKQKRK